MLRVYRRLLLTWLLARLIPESYGLKIIKFDVPLARANGSSAVLHCDYDLENSELYSVKFYKDYVEFYRYLPNDYPRAQSFKLDGIYLNLAKSNASHVVLYKTDLASDGLYACEISTEAPAFATRKNEKMMKIYVLPEETLTIERAKNSYKLNEQVEFICITGQAWPMLQLAWYINDVPARPEQLLRYKPMVASDGGALARSRLGLRFVASEHYFQYESLHVRCAASLNLVYQLKAFEYLIDGFKKAKSASKRYTDDLAQINSKDIPYITGVREKYNVNDTVRLNCTTTATRAELSWHMNGHQANASNLIRYAQSARQGLTILGLEFYMLKKYFQTEELELQCVATFQKTIADYQEQVIIKTFDSQFLLQHTSRSRPSCCCCCYCRLCLLLTSFLVLLCLF